jgi:hypothetical protein
MKNLDKKRKLMITFSDAMKEIDESRDFNEYGEINSSGYFQETMNNADYEINKMMSSPLISIYRRYKRPNNTYQNMLKRDKEYIMNRLIPMDKIKLIKKKQEENSQKKKKIKINPIFDRLAKIKIDFSNYTKTESNEEKVKNKKLLLTSGNIPFFPKINKNFSERKKIIFKPLSKKRNSNSEDIFLKTKIENKHYFSKTHNKTLNFYEINHRSSNKNLLKSMYNECLKGIENLEYNSQEQKELKFSSKMKVIKPIDLEDRLYNNDEGMNKYLIENINIFNENNRKKNVNIAKQLEDIRLKRDPILKLSEEFAYKNRKPLFSLFNYGKNDKENMTARKGPLAQLKVKDAMIMKSLEKDNRNKNLLIKRLEEDQAKYKKGGYFFEIMKNEEEPIKVNPKKNGKDDSNKNMDEENNILNKENNTENKLIKTSLYESQRNILLKK